MLNTPEHDDVRQDETSAQGLWPKCFQADNGCNEQGWPIYESEQQQKEAWEDMLREDALRRQVANSLDSDGVLSPMAQRLGVSVKALRAVQCRYIPKHRAYAFLEHDGRDRLVGILWLTLDGRHGLIRGSQRGLTVPWVHYGRRKPIHVAVGPQNVAALLTVGAMAIGRPFSTADTLTTIWLAQFLVECPESPVVILGENAVGMAASCNPVDPAFDLATTLAGRFGKRIKWALPASGFHDVHEQILAGAWKRGIEIREPAGS
jgi:hypothetical protein